MSQTPLISRAGDASLSTTGRAAPPFEGEVGAHYLLTMLIEVDPPLPEGSRFFPWRPTRGRSRHAERLLVGGERDSRFGGMVVRAGRLARRGDRRDLEVPGSPTAFLLVAVDVLISQWTRIPSAGLPLLGSPDLLTFDRMRPTQKMLLSPNLDPLAIPCPQEPVARVTRADLEKRPSRRISLESLIDVAARSEKDLRHALHDLLARGCLAAGGAKAWR